MTQEDDYAMPRFIYASYYSRERALDKLEDMFAAGDVCEGEHPAIVYQTGKWCIMLVG